MIINDPQGDMLDITGKQLSEITWNKDVIIGWANAYAARFVGLLVTEENLAEMESAKRELSSKKRRLDEFRLEQKRMFEAPFKRFEAEIKEVDAVLTAVETPLKEQIQKFEDQRRCEAATNVSGWIQEAIVKSGLRARFASQIAIAESWTNKTAVKSKVKQEIDAKVQFLLTQQQVEDQAEELRRQRFEMAESMCAMQSAAMGLAVPVTPANIYGIEKLSLVELSAAITAAIAKQQSTEHAAVARAEAQKVATEEKRRLDADRAAAAEAIKRVEAQEVAAAAVDPQWKITVTVFGTEAECQQFLNIVDGNGYNYVLGGMEEVKKEGVAT
jgi:hypothetical protein